MLALYRRWRVLRAEAESGSRCNVDDLVEAEQLIFAMPPVIWDRYGWLFADTLEVAITHDAPIDAMRRNEKPDEAF